ncbi:TetR family transcriptional regulator [Microbacteriaceae bacterium VKM Ac-2854]|nr:TetR family transcriptional regulator [Microbacteriaceae bacterium VKM Ac-2854]
MERTRRGRSSVTAEEILQAAEELAAGGFDAVTMRAVATRMGASPMALYRYFATKDELVSAMLDRALGRIVLPVPSADWRQDLDAFARAHRAVLAAHPWAVIPLFTYASPGLNASRIGEAALAILARGGVTGTRGVATFSAVLALNYGWFSFSAARDARREDADPEAELAAGIAALPPDLFPQTRAVADELAHYGSEQHYSIALGLLLAGL